MEVLNISRCLRPIR